MLSLENLCKLWHFTLLLIRIVFVSDLISAKILLLHFLDNQFALYSWRWLWLNYFILALVPGKLLPLKITQITILLSWANWIPWMTRISWPYEGSFLPSRLFVLFHQDHRRKYHLQKLCAAFSITRLALALMWVWQIRLKSITLSQYSLM